MIGSPLAPPTNRRGQRSLRLRSPRAPIASTPNARQLRSTPARVASKESLVLLESASSASAVSLQCPHVDENVDETSPFTPSANVQGHTVSLSSAASITARTQTRTAENGPTSISSADARDVAATLSSTELPAPSAQCLSIQSSSKSTTATNAQYSATDSTSPSIKSSLSILPAASEQGLSASSPPELGQSSAHNFEPVFDVGEVNLCLRKSGGC